MAKKREKVSECLGCRCQVCEGYCATITQYDDGCLVWACPHCQRERLLSLTTSADGNKGHMRPVKPKKGR